MTDALIAQLDEVRAQRGTLTPEIVVEVARDPRHPLHARFDWDDTVAAEKWRLVQAGQLLRVTYRPDPAQATDLRAFVAVKGVETPRSEYVPTAEAMADPMTRLLVLRAMEREWHAYRRRYEHMAEFAEFIRRQVEETSA